MKNKGIIITVSILAVLVVGFLGWQFLTKTSQYTVTFEANGGSEIGSIKVDENEVIEMPTTPIREGYTFIGWYLDSVQFDFSQKITKDITLEARWQINDDDNDDEFAMTLNKTSLSLVAGKSDTLSVTFTGTVPSNKNVTWSSSNTGVATVDANGKVTTVKEGSAIITATSFDGTVSVRCTVTVSKTPTPTAPTTPTKPVTSTVDVTGVNATVDKETLNVGETVTLSINVTPTNATNKNVTYTSSNTDVATVDANGKVTANKSGTVTITVKSNNDKTATIDLTINDVYTYKVVQTTEDPLFSKIYVYKNSVDISASAGNVLSASNVNLGAYSSAKGAIMVPVEKVSSISKIVINKKMYTVTKVN